MTTRVVSVGMLTTYLRQVLESDDLLADIWVEGEVSDVFSARSGHLYFTLRDEDGQIKCVLFRPNAVRQTHPASNGDQLAVHGRVSLYDRTGAVQLYVDVIQPAGIGLAALELEHLRLRLDAEGLFNQDRKRPLPAAPRVIAVVTSVDGAVWHDIQHVVARRYPFAELVLATAAVQGERAPASLVEAIEAVNTDDTVDVLIVARGGGSAEDLKAFNDERVVRAIFSCRVPVVTGIGHETDWTLADGVADVRAPTPSVAAELCVPSIGDMSDDLALHVSRLHSIIHDIVDSGLGVVAANQSIVYRASPADGISRKRATVEHLRSRLQGYHTTTLAQQRQQVEAQYVALRALSPLGVLNRGYVVLHDAASLAPVRQISDAVPGRPFVASFVDGVASGVFADDPAPVPIERTA